MVNRLEFIRKGVGDRISEQRHNPEKAKASRNPRFCRILKQSAIPLLTDTAKASIDSPTAINNRVKNPIMFNPFMGKKGEGSLYLNIYRRQILAQTFLARARVASGVYIADNSITIY